MSGLLSDTGVYRAMVKSTGKDDPKEEASVNLEGSAGNGYQIPKHGTEANMGAV